jgi:hypothetical protein
MRMNMTGSRVSRALLILLATCGGAACGSEPPVKAAAVGGPEASPALNDETARMFENVETHADSPPHGGVVVELGSHAAHAEVVLVPDSGEVTVHILDADGQPGKRIAQPSILADVETSGRSVRLELQAAPLDDEMRGDASRFSGTSEELIRAGEAKVVLRWILVDGVVYSDSAAIWGGAGTE